MTQYQAVSKTLLLADVVYDDDLADLWTRDKLERRSAWSELRAVSRMLEAALGPDALPRSHVPAECTVRPGMTYEKRCMINGYWVFTDTRDGTHTTVLGPDFDVRDRLVVNHCIDRGSIGAAGLGFAISDVTGLMWPVHFGEHHDRWNAVKAAMKTTRGGVLWRSIVKFSSVANLGFGPFRSGAWRSQMREHLAALVAVGPTDEFRDAARNQGLLQPRRFTTASDPDSWWHIFGTMPPFTESGPPILKFQRWFSVGEVWKAFRDVWFLQKPVLQQMAHQTENQVGAVMTTSTWDAETGGKKKHGLLDKAPNYINWDIAIHMDIFQLTTKAFQDAHSRRSVDIKSVDQWVAELGDRVGKRGWMLPYSETIRISLREPGWLTVLSPLGFVTQEVCWLHFETVLNILGENILREAPDLWGYPGHAALLLERDPAFFTNSLEHDMDEIVTHWRMILKAEEKAVHGCSRTAALLDDIIFLKWPFVRLFFCIVERDVYHGNSEQSVWFAKSLLSRLGDEKVPEDFHAHVRAAQKESRHTRISLNRIYSACQVSGVLESRQGANKCVQVPFEDIAAQKWEKSKGRRSVAENMAVKPEGWTKKMDKILLAKTWPTLNTATLFSSTMTWLWFLEYTHDCDWKAGTDPAAAWWTRLLAPRTLIYDKNIHVFHVVVRVSNFSCIVIDCERLDGMLYLTHDAPHFFIHLFITDPTQQHIVPFKPVHHTEHGIGLELLEDARDSPNLLRYALLNPRRWTVWELQSILLGEREKSEPTASHAELFKRVVSFAFDTEEEQQTVLELNKDPPKEVNDDTDYLQDDVDLQELLEEIAEDDLVNQQDLKAFKHELKRKTYRGLMKRRQQHRQAQVKASQARRARKKVVKKVNPKLLKKAARAHKPAPPARGGAGGGGAPPAPAPLPAAPTGPPPPPAAPPASRRELPRNKAPKGGGKEHWRVAELAGDGWIRFSATNMRGDAHCPGHDDGVHCKLDRRLKFGTLGLSYLWLRRGAGCTSAAEHSMLKEVLSYGEAMPNRQEMRDEMVALSAADPLIAELLQLEAQARDGATHEPESLPCRPIMASILSALGE